MNNIIKAVAFAADKHRAQRRKDLEASPYINHPIALANVLANEADIDEERVVVAASSTIELMIRMTALFR
jgi:GTP diphosphokinase / guanosine-3',5'-bis(diphosphate) 3'-diphosphatase